MPQENWIGSGPPSPGGRWATACGVGSRQAAATAATTRAAATLGALLIAVGAPAQPLPAQAPDTSALALVGGMLVDGYETPPTHHAAVVIRGNRIVATGPASQVDIPEGARVIDTRGKTMLPGLVDLHVHADLLGHGDYDRWYEFIGGTARLPEIIPLAARQMLRAGVTTALDLGAPLVILEVRDRMAAGEIPGPRLLATGPWITRVTLEGVPLDYQRVVSSPKRPRAAPGSSSTPAWTSSRPGWASPTTT